MTATTIPPTTSSCAFNTMPIAGRWRGGTSSHITVDLDPWNGAELTRYDSASANDVDDAFAAGGEKASGLGRFGGDWAIAEFTTDHWVSVQHTPRTFPL